MPMGNYKWNTAITLQQILDTSADADVGFFVDVDRLYPKELHDNHNGLPLAPEKRQILPQWFSAYAKSFGLKPNKVPKLVESLFDKKLRLSLRKFEILCKAWISCGKTASCVRV